MSNVKFQLSLNKHPKDCPNYSLVGARNVRVSDDFSCLQSEESIFDLQAISITLDSDYRCELIDIIPCNKELVIFAKNKEDDSKASIFRYNEDNDLLVQIYNNKLEYGGGRIIGTFTYNINNELIIAFSEYTEDGAVPLKTINLGVWDGVNTVSEESDFEDGKLALSPEVIIPKVINFNYITGTSYKGWYYYFIRYKINKTDYTRWFPIGCPIFINSLELKNIFKYGLNNGERTGSTITNSFILSGASDYISSKDDICNESVSINIGGKPIKYDYIQLGFCCISKTYSKAFRTADISKSNFKTIGGGVDEEWTYEYIMNISNSIEYTVSDLILNNYNYYNVKNVINYKNRLYISNYKENNIPIISQEELDKINIYTTPVSVSYDDIRYKDLVTNKEYTDDSEGDIIPIHPILYLKDNNQITLETDNQVQISNPNFEDCFILTNNQNKIYPKVNFYVDSNTAGIRIELTFEIGYNTYTSTLIWAPGLSLNWYIKVVDANIFDSEIKTNLGFNYINTNNSFDKRKLNSTLIPGEIYSFYIHFVNKYGEATQGYKLSNNIVYRVEGKGNNNYFPISLGNNGYLLAKLDSSIFNSDGTLNKTDLVIKTNFNHSENVYYFYGDNLDYTVDSALSALGLKALIPGLTPDVEPYPSDVKWYEIFSTRLNVSNHPFSYYINSNKDKLFKVPDSSFIFDETTYTIKATTWKFKFDLNDFTIPEGYIGYYFSYEKFEYKTKVTGILSKFDIFEQDNITGASGDTYKKYNSESRKNIINANFYSDRLNIDDNLSLDYNFIRQETGFSIYKDDLSDVYNINKIDTLSTKYPINYNKVEVPTTDTTYGLIRFKYTPINEIQLNKANKVINGKFGVGTSLSIKLTSDQANYLFYGFDYVRVSLLKINKNIYTNENKILIKFTNIYYVDDNKVQTVNIGLNGHITYQGTLIYNYNKFIMSAENVILTEQFRPYYRCPIYESLSEKWIGENRPPVAYLQQVCYSDTFYETKSFKNEPEVLFQNLENIKTNEEQVMPFAANLIITPANSIDVFQELQTNQDLLNPKTYLAFSNSRKYLTKFDKRVQRSNVISDESLANSWRIFPLEGYKDISENKGKITNLVGIGTTLLVHTEHSLFAFDGSNTLKTGDDKDVRLALPDIFDIDYIEVFTSDLGVCGLQDKEACIAGQFGYIFYDNDAHRFYKFASKKAELIDYDIVQFLNHNIPYNVRFGYDIERNRLLINFDIRKNIEGEVTNLTISYNTQLNKFISLHTYSFNKAVNTKSTLYLIKDNFVYVNALDTNRSRHNIQRRDYRNIKYYVHFDNGTDISPKISIIVNDAYSIIKTIEFLTYKLFKRINDATGIDAIDIANERERSKVPYSGFKIRVHNDMCDTGDLDVSVDDETAKNILMNYKKPWWEFGNWNFNYLRDTKYSDSSHDIMSRIYGNYFIIDIIFYDDNNPYNQKIEFEDLAVQLINDETV